ncbi:MAG: type I DNA topoisomerase [Candidatus Eremiobacteraeota bacterium]|nr:type I DNA topoisomerase [Candidatus Eremiobacteraeota bacterium]
MSKSLIIVESPAKARTLKKFLGSRYQVLPSVGHVRDLPKSRLGVDVDHDFSPTYVTIKGKGPVIKDLRSAVKKASHIYLATDPDREGEAIAWHLAEVLKLPDARRIELHEITKSAVQEALKHSGSINMDRVDAQQARRILDRLVGYKISPMLWRKIQGGLSAGRVQSVAVKLIVDREREIEAFKPREYWTVSARLWPRGHHDAEHTLLADLVNVDGKKLDKFDIPTEADATRLEARLSKASYSVTSVKTREVRRSPAAPFTTSTLQQEASRRLKMRVRRTMQIAQGLYEGVDVGEEGTTGLITYMRTDSTRLSSLAMDQAREFINHTYGAEYHNGKQFKVSADAQDAHEAIRPTDVNRTPERLKQFLDPSQLRVYRLIWERFVASQMAPAVYDQTTVEIEADGCGLRATGTVLKFAGYTKIYEETPDEDATEEDERKKHLPPVEEGQAMDLRAVLKAQHWTEPPPRYTEASLVKTLEEKGVGRPSTYATIVDTIQRHYTRLEQRRFMPTPVGIIVNDVLVEFFPDIFNETFTSEMEQRLDRVEERHDDWVSLLRDFYSPFAKDLARAEEFFPKVEIEEEEIDETCPACGRPMKIKNGRFGKFIACTGYPECKTTKPIVKDSGVVCPQDGGRILERKSKKGRIFFGCEKYPACDFVAWDPPIVGSACKECGSFLVRKWGRNGGRVVCARDAHHEHGYVQPEASSNGVSSGLVVEHEEQEKRSA